MRDSLENLSHSKQSEKVVSDKKFEINYQANKVEETPEQFQDEEEDLRASIAQDQNTNILEVNSKEERTLSQLEKRDSNEPLYEEDEKKSNSHLVKINEADIASESPQSKKRVPSKALNTSNKKSQGSALDFKNLDPVNKLRAARNKNSRKFIDEFNRSLDKIYYTTTNMKKRESKNSFHNSNSKKATPGSRKKILIQLEMQKKARILENWDLISKLETKLLLFLVMEN